MSDASESAEDGGWFKIMILKDEECNADDMQDEGVHYFNYFAFVIYVVLFLFILADLKYWWSLDKAQHEIYYYVDNIKRKLTKEKNAHEDFKQYNASVKREIKQNNDFGSLVRKLRTQYKRAKVATQCGDIVNSNVRQELPARDLWTQHELSETEK